MIKDLLVSIAGGALVGWLTNSIAVNMLFRKFFGRWGGVIESGYKELIQNLSSLVEKKLVNARTLETVIQASAFNDTLRLWVREILEEKLPARTGNLRVKDIPGIDLTLESASAYFEQERIEPYALDVLNGIRLGQIICEDSYRGIVEKNSEKIYSIITEYRDVAGGTLKGFFSGLAFRDILSEDSIRQIKANINEAACKIASSDAVTGEDFETFAGIIGIDRILKKIEELAGEARIGELAPDMYGAARAALNHLADFLESGPGRDLLREAAARIIDSAETLDTKLSDILRPDLIEELNAFIKRSAPDLVDALILFIIDSRDEIDLLIDEAAGEHFNRGGRVNNPLQAFLFEAVSKTTGFTNRIIETLSRNRNGAGEKLAAEFTSYIQTTSVGGLVSALKESGVINAGTVAGAIPGKLREARLENIEFLKTIGEAKLKDIIPNLDLSFIKTKILPATFGLLRESFRKKTADNRLREKIDRAIDSFAAKKVCDTVDFTRLKFTLNDTDLKNFMLRLWTDAAEISSGSLFAGMSAMLPWRRIAERAGNARMNAVNGVLQNGALYGRTADAVQGLILRNLDTVLGGSVFEIAKNEMATLSPHQVNGLVHDFMGTQLKPINVIGAVLGGLAGALTAAAALFFRLPSGFLLTMFAVYGLIFALVGVGTNWIAVKMLFRPYKRIAGLGFPPFIGVTALKQPEFAAGIARLIQKNMLNESALRRFYAGKKDSIYALCRERLSAENYGFIDDFLSDDTRCAAAVDGALDLLCDYIKTSNTKIAQYIDGYVTDRIESGLPEDFIASLTDALFQKIKDGGAAHIGRKMRERIEDKSFPEHEASKIIDALLALFYQYLQKNLRNILSAKTLGRHETAFADFIESHTPDDISGGSFLDFLKKLAEKTGALPRKAEAAIAKLAAGLKTDGRWPIKDCFGGAIPALLKSKAGLVNGLIRKLAGSQKSAIVDRIMDRSGGASFLDRLVRRAANAMLREDVEAITEILIDEKLLPFLEARRDAVLGILDGALESPPGFDCKVFNEDNTRLALSRIFASEPVLAALKNLSTAYLENSSRVKLKSLLSPLNMDTIGGFMERASPIMNIAVCEITPRLDDEETLRRLDKLFSRVIAKVSDGEPLSLLLRGIDLEAESRKISTLFFARPAAAETTKIILKGILQKVLSGKDVYEHTLFRRDISFFLKNCADKNKTSPPLVKSLLAGPLRGLLKNISGSMSPQTKDFILCDQILPAMLDACENQFPGLVDSLSLYSVVEREINAMHPAEIEGVFYSFAGPYFKKIILYGWIGLFGGLLSYVVGCLLPLLP